MKKHLLLATALFAFSNVLSQTVQFSIPTSNKSVYSIVRYNNTIYIGGEFDTVGTTARSHLAALDANSGAVLPWNPAPDQRVNKLLIAGGKLIVEGYFNNISGSARNGVGVYDLATGVLLNSSIGNISGGPAGLAQQGNFVYYCDYDTMGGLIPKRFDINTLQDDATWQGNESINGDVKSVTTLGNYVYAGGWFYLNNFFNIEQICRYNISTGALDTTFHFAFNSSDYITEVLGHNGMLYVTGNYTMFGGIARNGIAEIDPSGSGTVTTKNIYCSNHYNWALAPQGNTIWIGGNSVAIGGINRYTIAQVDLFSGFATCWFTQALSGNVYHYCIFPTHDTVYVAPYSSGFKALTGNPGIVDLGNDTVICPGGSITLTAPPGLMGYNWSNGAMTQSITVNTPGNYWVSATDPGGCLMSGTRVITACTGLANPAESSGINVYPTFSEGKYRVEFMSHPGKGQIEVHDINGNLVLKQEIPAAQEKTSIDISTSAKGIYLLKLSWGMNQVQAAKIVKE